MNIRPIIPILAIAALAAGPLRGQATENLLSTVGTVVERDGHHYAYILWQPDKAAATFGKRFAIYSKNGDIPTAAPYARLGIQTLQTSPETIRAMLNLGDKVDFDPGAAAPQIANVYQSITLQLHPAAPPPADPNLDAAGKLAYMIAAATGHNEVLDQLFMLARAHPGVMLALGHAFMIEVPATGVKTYELREVDGSDHDVQVFGRVELDPANPPVPPAPGPPVAVSHPVREGQYLFSQKDDLNARLRWGMDDSLRRMLPYTFGFDVFRVKKADAIALGWNSAPPSRLVLIQGLVPPAPHTPPTVVRANGLPVLPDKTLTLAQAADAGDRETFFCSDDNGIAKGHAPFHDGDEFYYFVAARTITGEPGDISPGTLVQMCDRMPPLAPRIAAVENVFVKPTNPADWALQGGTQHLRVKIRQLPEGDPSEAASEYRVYRWKSSKQYLVQGGDPAFNLVGTVAHVPGEKFVYFADTGAGAPGVADAGKTVWYTARAVDSIACPQKNFSAHSAPKFGVIRDRKGPPAPTGAVSACRYVPVAEYKNKTYERPGDYGSDGMRRELRVQAARDSPLVASFDVRITADRKRTVAEVNVPFRVGAERGITFQFDEARQYQIEVRGISATGLRGAWCQPVNTAGEGGGRPPYDMPVYHFNISISKTCRPAIDDPNHPSVHEAVGPDGSINPILGWLSFAADVREWRVYRRVGRSGALSLIDKGQGELLNNPDNWSDPHMPSTPGTVICYYGQVFDENGNPSPLERIRCVRIIGPKLPVPMVEVPKMLEDLGSGMGRIRLDWFCDPAGADRFELLVATNDGSKADPESDDLSNRLSDTPLTGVTDQPAGLLFYPYQTTRLEGGLGTGPEFSVVMKVPLGKTLYFAVRAVGPGSYGARPSGANSNVVSGFWSPPAEPGATGVIPWPARALPDRYDIQRNVADYGEGEGPFYAFRFPQGWSVAAGILVGMCNGDPEFEQDVGNPFKLYTPTKEGRPEDYIFDVRVSNENGGSELEDLMPFMVYRYQLPSEAYPEAVPNIVQCTPLIDRLSWRDLGWSEKNNREAFELRDPFFAFVLATARSNIKAPVDGVFSRNPTGLTLGYPEELAGGARPPYSVDRNDYMIVVDRLPVAKGAKYQYLIVSFCKRGEIRRVIPVNPVQQ